MCCIHSLELVVIPFLIVPALISVIICMSSNSWLKIFIDDTLYDSTPDYRRYNVVLSDQSKGYLFGELSPWYLCAIECIDCPLIRRSSMDCFWMRDWASTGFATLSAIQYLEYWCLGCLVLSLFPILVSCLDRRGQLCPLDCTRPAIALLFLSAILSVVSVITFGIGKYETLDEFAEGHLLKKKFGWPYYVRWVGSLLMAVSAFLSLLHEFKRREGYIITDSDEEKVIVVSVDDEDEEGRANAGYGEAL